MKIRSLIAVCVLILRNGVLAEGENEVKRGIFPFMAFVYYPDETVVDSTGARFIRGALLIRPEWLISSAIDHSVLDNVPLGFPRKTLLARVGAITIDANFTLNEDEDEQEREVIQIVRPSVHNLEAWWLTDITLLKTLLPFNMTPAVSITTIHPKREYTDKNCIILVYAKKYVNSTDEKTLMQLSVELLPPSIENCGSQFSETTMTCASDSDETKNAVYDPDFCQGNAGGPLMCEGEVMGLQTYIDNNCKAPHLYQLLSAWETLISCGTQEKCNQDYCINICAVTNKDSSPIPRVGNSNTISSSIEYSNTTSKAVSSQEKSDKPSTAQELSDESGITTKIETSSAVPLTELQHMSTEEKETEVTSTTVNATTEEQTTITTSTKAETTTTEVITTDAGPTDSGPPETSISNATETPSESMVSENISETAAWSNEKYYQNKMVEGRESDAEDEVRRPNVEAQQVESKIHVESSSVRNMCLVQTLFLGFFVVMCVM